MHEGLAQCRRCLLVTGDTVQGAGKLACGLRMQPAQRFVRGPRREQREYVRGVLQQPARFAGGEVPTAQFEVLVQRLWFGGAVEMFLEALQQAVVDPPHDRRAAIEALHHLLDRERIAIVGIAEAFGQQLLEVEAQAFLAPSGD